MEPSLFTSLDHEWLDFAADPAALARLAEWAIDEPRLARFDDLASLVRYLHHVGTTADSDAILAALACRAADDVVAARTLLQAVLYALVPVSVRFRTGDDVDDVNATVIAAAWERIRTYPIDRRPRHIATNIVLDTQQTVSRTLFRARVIETSFGDLEGIEGDPPGPTATDELLGMLIDAVRDKHLRPEEASLIASTRIYDVSVAQIASAWGCKRQSVRKRRRRAEVAMAAALG